MDTTVRQLATRVKRRNSPPASIAIAEVSPALPDTLPQKRSMGATEPLAAESEAVDAATESRILRPSPQARETADPRADEASAGVADGEDSELVKR